MPPTIPQRQLEPEHSWSKAAHWIVARQGATYWILAVGLLLLSPALLTRPVADDLLHELVLRDRPGVAGLESANVDLFRFSSGNPEQSHALIEEAVFPWWANPHTRLAFFRPLAGLTHWLDWHWLGNATLWKHLHSLLWYAAMLAAVAASYARFAARPVALLALLLYAVDDAHAPAVAWVANRNAVMSIYFSMLALGAHDAWRRSGKGRLGLLGPCWLALALLAGETGLTAIAYLLAYAVFLERGTLRERAATLLGPLAVLALWQVTRSLLGYGVAGSGVYVDPISAPLEFLSAAAERLPVLLLGAVAFPWSDWWEVYPLVSPGAAPWVYCFALSTLLGILALIAPLLRTNAVARFWGMGALLSALPATATFPHDRLLLGMTIGWMALLAELLVSTTCKQSRLRRVAVSSLALIHALLAPVLMPLRAANVDHLTGVIARSSAPLLEARELTRSTVVLLNPPVDPLVAYLPLFLESTHQPRPRHLVWLATGVSSLQVRRLDPWTLSIRPEGGYLSHSSQRMLRDASSKIAIGYTVQLDAVTIRVEALTSDGRPAQISARFVQRLDDPLVFMFRWEGKTYKRFSPPAIGEEVTLPVVDILDALSG